MTLLKDSLCQSYKFMFLMLYMPLKTRFSTKQMVTRYNFNPCVLLNTD
jgi:hypothetical protein